jgi:hypothetical protein
VTKTKETFVRQTFVISSDDYMGCGSGMHKFVGTFRELLLHVLDAASETADMYDEEDGPIVLMKAQTTADLKKIFDGGNGDGQPFVMAFCVETNKQVLGK